MRPSRLRSIVSDRRGAVSSNVFSMAPTWFVVFGVFLMNVQLSRNYVQRDMVDHAAAMAADTTMKTLCADAKDFGGAAPGQFSGGRATAVRGSVEGVLGLASNSKDCKVTATPTGTNQAGGREVDVEVRCEFPCEVPFAAQLMCSGSPRKVTFVAKQKTVAMGCDMKDG